MNTEPPIIFQESSGFLGQLAVGKHRYRTKHELYGISAWKYYQLL
jgi:flagellar assembly factor FliW